MRSCSYLLYLSLFAGGPLATADVCVYERTVGLSGNVRVVDETGQLPDVFPPALQDIELLPIDFVGRTAWDQLRAGRPRLIEDLSSVDRVVLPGGRGVLYGYRRVGALTSVFGFFSVGPSGNAAVLLMHDGTGAMGAVNPFCPKLAVEDGGRHLLIATRPEAGGDLFEVDVVTGTVAERTTSVTPRNFQTNGLALLPGWGLASTPGGLLRFARTPGAQVRRVPFGGGVAGHASFPSGLVDGRRTHKPDWVGPDIVTSGDGSTAAFCAGLGPTQAFVYTVGQLGLATRATHEPQNLSGAGFLPESSIGPTLALSSDGSMVAWRIQNPLSAETFVGRVATAAPASIQLTADANYIDTLNDSGVIVFYSPDELVMLVGETDSQDSSQIDRADMYRVSVANLSAPVFENLSMTSGDGVVPFLLPGTLDTDAGLVQVPDGSGALVLSDGPGGVGTISHIDLGTTVVTPLVDLVKSWPLVVAIGNDLLLNLERDFAPNNFELYRLLPGEMPQLMSAGASDGYSRWSVQPDSFGGIATDAFGNERVGRVKLSTGLTEVMLPMPTLGPAVHFTSSGSLAWSMDGAGQSSYFLWHPDGSTIPLLSSSGLGFLLPGN